MLNDICRCLNEECPERETCLRWIEREPGEVHSCLNLWGDEPCESKIEAERSKG